MPMSCGDKEHSLYIRKIIKDYITKITRRKRTHFFLSGDGKRTVDKKIQHLLLIKTLRK